MASIKNWYEELKEGVEQLGIQSVLFIMKKIEEAEGKETQEKVDEIYRYIKELELTEEESKKIFEKFRNKSKTFNSPADSLNFIKNKLKRKARLLQNRVDRAIPDGFGPYIRYLRERLGYSLKEVDELTGISASYINRIEQGQRKAPSYPILEKLAEAYKVDVTELLKIAGINADDKKNVKGFAEIVYTNNFTINGKIVSKKKKELIVELVTKIDELKWGDEKHKESIKVLEIIDRIKALEE
jgi:transcriptional regulator with XRE-family HTH domain